MRESALEELCVRVLDEHSPGAGLVPMCRCGVEWTSTHGAEMIRREYRRALIEGLPDPTADHVGVVGRSHPVTSRRAALQVYPATGSQRARVLEAIIAAGERGRTDHELVSQLGINTNSVHPRRGELIDGGWIEDSGEKRRTPSGAGGIVWVLTEQAKARLDGARV